MKCIPHVKVLFASNSLPMLKEYDAENAFVNRIQVLRFTKSIPREKWDIELSQKIINERNVIFSRAVLESQKFIKTLIFTDDPDSEGVLDNFRKENSTVQAFISERLESTGKNTDYICTADLYDDYSDYCESECLGALKKKDFHKILTQMGFEFGKKRPSRNQSPRASVLGVRRKPYDTVEG